MSEIPIVGEVVDSERDTTGTEWLTLRLNKEGQRLLSKETEDIMVKVADFRQHGAVIPELPSAKDCIVLVTAGNQKLEDVPRG